jgi:predicted metal-dependent enzyme (double-stranded beta helix superfamily)
MSDATRAQAVAATVDRVKAIAARGITRDSLAAMQAELEGLARQDALFPSEQFPPPPAGEKGSKRYLLAEDADGRFALYMLALNPGNETKPHDHTTWAILAAVAGEELNRVYARADDGSDPDRCDLKLSREVVVKPGQGLALMPADIHSIHTQGTQPTRHLHMYGLALERLDERKAYDAETGEVKAYNRNFMTATANR